MVKYWRTWCPLGKTCGKKNAQLCKKKTYGEAYDFLENHLSVSPFHKQMPKNDRDEWMLKAEILEDEEDADEEDQAGQQDGAAGAAGAAGSAGWGDDAGARIDNLASTVASLAQTVERSMQHVQAESTAVTRRRPAAIGAAAPYPRPPPIQLSVPAAGDNPMQRCLVALRRAETGMANASQVAIAASTVFTTEAANVARAIDQIEAYMQRE